MFRKIALFVFLASLFLSCAAKADATLKESISTNIDSIASHFIADGKVMGISVAIQKQNTLVYNKGFGFADTARSVPVNNDHIFMMASISKLIGSTVVMKLVEEGKFTLDQTLFELLPEFPNKDQAKKIKLRHLISHTSGLPEYMHVIDSIYETSGREPSQEHYFNFFKDRELDYEPGTFYKYCNSGFVLMAMIIERATGKTYQSEIDRIINKPAGINIKLIENNVTNPNLTHFFNLEDSIMIRRLPWKWIKGDGGLTASAKDLVQFPHLWKNAHIISKESFNMMISPNYFTKSLYADYGFGVKIGEIADQKLYGHSGGDKSTWAMMFHFPESDHTLVVFVNTNKTRSNAKRIFGEIALALFEKDVPNYLDNEATADDLSLYTGRYKQYGDREGFHVELNPKDQHLYFRMSDQIYEKLYYMGNHKFWLERWPMDVLEFIEDQNGKMIAAKEYYTGYFSQLRQRVE